MQIRLIMSTFIQVGIYTALCNYNVGYYYILMGIFCNTVLVIRIFVGFGLKYTLTRLLRGQILPLYLYLLWLLLYPQQQHLYQIPIILSCIGKTYLLFSNAEDLWIDAIQNLIILQSQIQIFITFYHLLKLCIGRKHSLPSTTFQFILLLIIFKIKFQIHYGTRKSYQSIHFSLDRFSKNLKIRSFYHFLQRIVSNFAGDWHHSKIISY